MTDLEQQLEVLKELHDDMVELNNGMEKALDS